MSSLCWSKKGILDCWDGFAALRFRVELLIFEQPVPKDVVADDLRRQTMRVDVPMVISSEVPKLIGLVTTRVT
jgi:hypothetical protein